MMVLLVAPVAITRRPAFSKPPPLPINITGTLSLECETGRHSAMTTMMVL